MTTLETIVEELVELVTDIASNNIRESIRQRGQALLVADYHRRHIRDGKHPIAGETQEQYEAHMHDAARGGRGYHPVTGETIEHYEAEGHLVFGASEESPKDTGTT